MARRSQLSRKKSKRLFRKTASKTRRVNLGTRPMRGGYRI